MDTNDYYAEKLFSDFIYVRTYSRYLWEEKRREAWEETVTRYIDFIFDNSPNSSLIPLKVKEKARNYILNKEVMPSMRALWSSGENAKRDNTAMYNCAAIAVADLETFGEIMYILLAGAGVGFSVEARYITELPNVPAQRNKDPLYFKIPDTRLGWKQAIDFGISAWFEGRDVQFDYCEIRPAGSALLISGGYSSGPDPLRRALEFIRETILNAQERKLNSLEVADIVCEIANSVVCGGVRRSSTICLCDVEDDLLRNAKQGTFHPRRYLMNISAVYRSRPDVLSFTQEFIDMAKSGSGERGIINLHAARKRAMRKRIKNLIALVNPCAEVALRADGEFCNLTEVVIRPWDDFDTVQDKVKTATWLGCCQATYTYFPHLRDSWTKNCEEERLLGVSLTGLCDNKEIVTPEALRYWKKTSAKTAKKASELLGINMPVSLNCVKPSGTVSSLVNASAGLHSRWAPYYIRRVRISMHDALFKMMVNQGMPYSLDKGNHDTAIFAFPIKSPDKSHFRSDDRAIEQLNWYRMIVENWADMNASCTIYVRNEEWLDVIKYVYDHFDTINGVSFFPYDNKRYEDAPYEEIDEETYNQMVEALPAIDFSHLSEYEVSDTTSGNREFACMGNSCEVA
jgi:ribonucleoside-triphosphate reductase (thioredoxin)